MRIRARDSLLRIDAAEADARNSENSFEFIVAARESFSLARVARRTG
jgi:hypothetical protein